MPQSADDRLETLEVKLAHLERALQDLNDVIWRQQQQLDAANARHQQLLDRLAAADRGEGAAAEQFEVPPHY
jgi:SlyX protein